MNQIFYGFVKYHWFLAKLAIDVEAQPYATLSNLEKSRPTRRLKLQGKHD
jgi:hypothetical protein